MSTVYWKLGVPATCNAGGAGKWRDELSESFRGADVVIIPDRDPQKRHPKTGELMFHPDGGEANSMRQVMRRR